MLHLLRGFHATSQERAKEIESSNRFHLSDNEWDWLGMGVYFYQDTLGFTRRWAEEKHGGSIENPAVFAADIEYDGFLDLIEHETIVELKSFMAQLQTASPTAFEKARKGQKGRAAEKERWRPRAHPLDCLIINEAARARELDGKPFRAIRSIFYDGDRLHQNSDIFDRQHIQIAVRDLTLIKRVWRVS